MYVYVCVCVCLCVGLCVCMYVCVCSISLRFIVQSFSLRLHLAFIYSNKPELHLDGLILKKKKFDY